MTLHDLFFKTSAGVRLNYAKGTDNATAIIFLPAQSTTWANYKSILRLLSQKLQVFSLSIRGHGKSDWTTGNYNFNNLGNDIVEFLEQVVKRPAILVGNSSGGLISLWVGVNRPDLVLGVVLEDAPLFSADWPRIKQEYVYDVLTKTARFLNKTIPDYQGLFSVMERPLPNGESKFLPAWMCKMFAYFIRHRNNLFIHFLIQFLPRKIRHLIFDLPTFDPDFSQAWVDGRIYEGLNHADALRKIKVPLLILHGDWYRTKKGLIGAMDDNDAKTAKELATHAKYLRIHVGHDIHAERPKEFANIISTFANELQRKNTL